MAHLLFSGSNCCFSHEIGITSRQNLRLYENLTHAQGVRLQHRLEENLAGARSDFMGRIVGRVFGFSPFCGFRADFGLAMSYIVIDARAVFPTPR